MLRDLAGFRAGEGLAVSVYLNLDPSVTPTAGDAATRMRSVLAEGGRRLDASRESLTHRQREALKFDLERVGRWFDEDLQRDGAHGVAVFASSLDELWSTIAVPAAVDDRLELDDDLFLTPLVPLARRGDDALVAFVGRERGQIFRLRGAELVEVADLTEDVPGRHDQGGRSQSRYGRHIEEIVARHLRRVADALESRVQRVPESVLVLVTTEETAAELESILSSEVKAAIVGRASAEAHATPAELLQAVTPVLAKWRTGREEELLARWREEAGREGRVSAGWPETLEAASDGRVDLMIVHEGANRTAYRCPQCRRAQATAGTCPLDGAPLEERPYGLDVAIHLTLEHGGRVEVVRDGRDLDPVEGIGAFLRF
jgi:peptide chain release factor subunit 1